MSVVESCWGGFFLLRASRNWGRRGRFDCRGSLLVVPEPSAMMTEKGVTYMNLELSRKNESYRERMRRNETRMNEELTLPDSDLR